MSQLRMTGFNLELTRHYRSLAGLGNRTANRAGDHRVITSLPKRGVMAVAAAAQTRYGRKKCLKNSVQDAGRGAGKIAYRKALTSK